MPDFVLFLVITCSQITGSSLLDTKTNIIRQYTVPYGFLPEIVGKKYIIVPHKIKGGHCA